MYSTTMHSNTPGKSSISILQEFAIVHYRAVPNYIVTDVSPSIQSPRFKVTVEVGTVSCSTQGSNKKQTKDASARLALEELGLNEDVKMCTNIPLDETNACAKTVTYNFVGVLNEYTSQNQLPYPTYKYIGTNEKGMMIVECKLGKVIKYGLGHNKKVAKKNAAEALLNALGSPKPVTRTNDVIAKKVACVNKDQVDSTISSTYASFNCKPQEIGIEISNEVSTEISTLIEHPIDDNEKKSSEVSTTSEETEEISELTEGQKKEGKNQDELVKEFYLKLSDLGIKNDDNLEIKENVNCHVLTYKNDDLNFKIIKISYNLEKTLDDIYENIKERFAN